jgi:precorrin-2/cobalt-factor-2 C20-methyltransferase
VLGTLNVIGIGPGDPELLTLKAVRIIKESDVLCVPKGREEGSSLALSIVEKAVNINGKEIIEAHFPMMKTREILEGQESLGVKVGARRVVPLLDEKWNKIAESITMKLRSGLDVAFLTLGDPTIYSTFFYLYDRLHALQTDLAIEIVPGVSSITASAARAEISLGLGNDKIAVLPANYMDDLGSTLESFNTVILMKVNKVFSEILRLLEMMGLTEKAICVSRAGMENEQIFRDIKKIKQGKLNYFSMIIVRK